MLSIYQRAGEVVRPWPTMSADLWTPPAKVGVGTYEITIADADEVTGFLTLADCPPVFVSIRHSASGLPDEVVLGIPEGVPGAAEQLIAAQLESALAAAEALPDEARSRIASAFGLFPAGSPGAGPRAMRTGGGPESEIRVSIISSDLRGDYALSRACPSLVFNSQTELLAVAELPEEYASQAFQAAADGMCSLGTKARRRIAAEFGLDLPVFLAAAERRTAT